MSLTVELFTSNELRPNTMLAGQVVLVVREQLEVVSITAKLKGVSYTHVVHSAANYQASDSTIFYELYKTEDLLEVRGACFTLGEGTYKYPFSFEIPGGCPPSFELDKLNGIKYYVKATVARPVYKRNLRARADLTYTPSHGAPTKKWILSYLSVVVLMRSRNSLLPPAIDVSGSTAKAFEHSAACSDGKDPRFDTDAEKRAEEAASASTSTSTSTMPQFSEYRSSSPTSMKTAKTPVGLIQKLRGRQEYEFRLEVLSPRDGVARGAIMGFKLVACFQDQMPQLTLLEVKAVLVISTSVQAHGDSNMYEDRVVIHRDRCMFKIPNQTIVDLSDFLRSLRIPAGIPPTFHARYLQRCYELHLKLKFCADSSVTKAHVHVPFVVLSENCEDRLPTYAEAKLPSVGSAIIA